VFTNVLGAQWVGRAVEVAGEIPDRTEITTGRPRRVITTLEFFEHDSAQTGRREPPYDPTIPDQDNGSTPRTRSVRRPAVSFKSPSHQLAHRLGWIQAWMGVFQAESYLGCAEAALTVYKNRISRPGYPTRSRGQDRNRDRTPCASIGEYFPSAPSSKQGHQR
jgi:hypothetical protein